MDTFRKLTSAGLLGAMILAVGAACADPVTPLPDEDPDGEPNEPDGQGFLMPDGYEGLGFEITYFG